MEQYGIEEMKRIYSHLGDEDSRAIYGFRLLHSLEEAARNSRGGVINVIRRSQGGRALEARLSELSGRERILFGAGAWGRALLRYFPEMGWSCFADNDGKKKEAGGLRVIGAEELFKEHREAAVVITARRFRQEIRRQLLEGGIPKSRIVDAGAMMEEMMESQYFDLPALRPVENEIFVDGGCYGGETSLRFARWSGDAYREIYAFEPDRQMCRKAGEGLAGGLRDFHLFNRGLWDAEGELCFRSQEMGASHIEENGEERVAVTSIDKELAGRRVTFIKLDIEGAELKALAGAGETIRKNRPRLAVSLYHKPEDVWEIPSLLLSYHGDYTFYLRHYSFNECETVLYAV